MSAKILIRYLFCKCNTQIYVLLILGTTRHFWGKLSNKPIWWPAEIPFRNVTKGRFIRSTLIRIIQAYKLFNSWSTALHETNEFCDSSPTHSLPIDPIPEVEDTHLSSSEDVIDLSKFNEDIIQDNSTRLDILPLNDTFEISNDSFKPGFSLFQDGMDENKQPEGTSNQDVDYALTSSPIAVLANVQTIYPLNVKFNVIEDSVKMEFSNLLSNPNTFLSGICMNSFMVTILIDINWLH